MADQNTAGTRFYVRVPEGQDEAWRVKHADETVNVVSAFFTAPHGIPVPQPDGTYEVRALAPSTVSIVRRMLTEHEGLMIVREEPLAGNLSDLLVTERPADRASTGAGPVAESLPHKSPFERGGEPPPGSPGLPGTHRP